MGSSNAAGSHVLRKCLKKKLSSKSLLLPFLLTLLMGTSVTDDIMGKSVLAGIKTDLFSLSHKEGEGNFDTSGVVATSQQLVLPSL